MDNATLRRLSRVPLPDDPLLSAWKPEAGEQLWRQAKGIWSQVWAANCQALSLFQEASLTRFSQLKLQRWVISSFEHHSDRQDFPHPCIHKSAIAALTTRTG